MIPLSLLCFRDSSKLSRTSRSSEIRFAFALIVFSCFSFSVLFWKFWNSAWSLWRVSIRFVSLFSFISKFSFASSIIILSFGFVVIV